ncbi:MAG: 16S rRNA (uracil(1498)-N(3))-methyltransferase [Victivallales bacterium]|nr:16S rRNA (uracil(1498)-N(3))-methyltransferase [Victivallales bacterium]
MNLILLQPDDFTAPGTVVLRDRRAEHAREVLQVREGDAVRVGILDGMTGTGQVIAATAAELTLEVVCNEPPPPPLPVTLLCALQRPKTLRKILQCAAAMGVKRIALLESWKVEKSYWQSPLLRPEALREQLILGLEQGRDTVLPQVTMHRRFRLLTEEVLPVLARGATALVAHPEAATSCPRGVNGPVVLAVGPEGGFTAYEIEKFAAAGFLPVGLGARVLRSEFAVAALLGRLF